MVSGVRHYTCPVVTKMELGVRIELTFARYKGAVMPLYETSVVMYCEERSPRIELGRFTMAR